MLNNTNSNIDILSFSVTPAQDAVYMSAVESGDMEKAERMVRDAAERAGYTAVGYHGTIGEVKRFYPDRKGNIFFAAEKEAAAAYALANAEQTGSEPNTGSAYLDLGKVKRMDVRGEN